MHPLCLEILNYDRKLKQEKQASNEESKDIDDDVIELPSLISGKVIEMT